MDNPERQHDADLHYLQAIEAMNREARDEGASASDTAHARARLSRMVDCRLALAHVSALRDQTEVLREIRDALGPRVEYSDDPQPDVPLELKHDIVERRQCDTQEAHQLRRQGWILLTYIPFGVTSETKRWTMGRPRTLPAEGVDPRD